MKTIRWILKVIPVTVAVLVGSVTLMLWLGRIDATVEAHGAVRIERFQKVRPPVGGVIARVGVRPGARVRRGQILLQLEDYELDRQLATLERELDEETAELAGLVQQQQLLHSDIHPLELAKSQSGLRRARFEADRANARVGELRVEHESLSHRYQRSRELASAGLISAGELEQASQAVLAAEWRLRQAEIEEKRNRADAAGGQEDLDLLLAEQRQALADFSWRSRERERRVDKLRRQLAQLRSLKEQMLVRAGMDGVIVGARIEELVGRHVASGEEVFAIVDPTAVRFVSYVPEEAILKVRTGQQVKVEITGVPKRRFEVFDGIVELVDQEPESQRTAEGVLYPVQVRLEKPWVRWQDDRFYLRDGMQGSVKIVWRSDIRIVQAIYDLIAGVPEG